MSVFRRFAVEKDVIFLGTKRRFWVHFPGTDVANTVANYHVTATRMILWQKMLSVA